MQFKIVIAEDEVAIRALIQLFLENRNFIVYPASNGEEALRIVQEVIPDLVLLDIEMPNIDGFEVCKKIREFMDVPIIFISSRRSVMDKVKSLDLGGDDYITKPFDFIELEARINANLRRYSNTKSTNENNIIRFDNLEIHLDSFECFVDREKVPLSTRELEILILLARNPNHVWSAEKLYDHIWGYESIGDVQTIKVHISNLRKKLNQYIPSANFIQTVRGFGYKFAY